MTADESQWQLMTAVHFIFNHLNGLVCQKTNYCSVLSVSWDMVKAADDSWWQLMTVDDSWRQMMTVDDSWWQLMTVDDKWWQLMTVDVPGALSCSESEFSCSQSGGCVPLKWTCDMEQVNCHIGYCTVLYCTVLNTIVQYTYSTVQYSI